MPESLYIRDDIVIPASELRFSAVRAGGPGGQYVNTTSSCVVLAWDLDATTCLSDAQKARIREKLRGRISSSGMLQVTVDTERSQHRNLQAARERLAALVRAALAVPRKRIPTKISAGAVRRRLEHKRRRSLTKSGRKSPGDDG